MKSGEAVEQIARSVFKPGWRMSAREFGPSLIYFTFEIDTVDTSYPGPDGVCRRKITLVRDDLFDVRELDASGLDARILKLADEIDEHENREFLKHRQPGGSWVTPLHPHTPAGNRAWEDARAVLSSR
jgi:hypothetical protein